MKKKNGPTDDAARPKSLVLVDKRGITQLLHDYECGVKSREQIEPFINTFFERLRHLNMELK
jgi:hypothetical protein